MAQQTELVRCGAVRVPDSEDGTDRPDYADAFEIRVPEPDGRTAEQWVRRGLEGAPPALRLLIRVVHRVVLGFRLGPHPSPDHVLGWRIGTSEPDVVRLEAASWLVRAVIVGRRVDPHTTRLTTFLFYERPIAARVVWTVVGPVHRRVAPYLLARAAAAPLPRSV